MSRRPFLFVAIPVLLALCTSANAQAITAFWQRMPITPQAIADDPALAEMQCWDLMTTTTGDWASAQMAATLPSSQVYYKHPLGTLTRPAPAAVSMSPALAYTTYVSSPSDDGTNAATIVLSGHPQSQLFPNLGDSSSLIPGFFSMFWADRFFTVDPPGTYQIARLTFPLGFMPNVQQSGDPSRIDQLEPDATVLIPDIPETTTAVPTAIAILIMMRSRRRCALASFGSCRAKRNLADTRARARACARLHDECRVGPRSA